MYATDHKDSAILENRWKRVWMKWMMTLMKVKIQSLKRIRDYDMKQVGEKMTELAIRLNDKDGIATTNPYVQRSN
nr:CLL_HP1_G0004420.mRNA.1.CDS.1 [Saccharomyces cerevisiae]